MQTTRRRFLVLTTVLTGLAAGCQDNRGPIVITSDDPDRKILAIRQDVADKNFRDVPAMVDGLSDDDSAVRFYCIEGLRKLTGDDFGYHFYQDPDQRAPAVARWRQWLAGRK